MSITKRLTAMTQDIERELEALFTGGRIAEHCARALMTSGKRLRPIATLLTGEAYGARREQLLPFATAVELVHTASLILDDLPAMDNASLRRGRPALHVEVGEAEAILTATALLARAFAMADLSGTGRGRRSAGRLVERLERAVGANGMCEGQALDLRLSKSATGAIEDLVAIHEGKTGALFAAAIVGGGIIGGAADKDLVALELFGKNLGLAYQIADDLLDATSDAASLGKPTGQDAGRVSFVSLYGIDASRRAMHDLHATARSALEALGSRADPLRQFAERLEARDA